MDGQSISAEIPLLADAWSGALERLLNARLRERSPKGRMNRLIKLRTIGFHDHCGVCGVFGHPEAAKMAYLGLYALQHRGQESAGIVSSDGRELHLEKSMGLVAGYFSAGGSGALAGRRGARPHALFDRRRYFADERAADRDRLQQGKAGAGAQRQSAERGEMAPHARASRLDFPDHQRHRSDRAPGGAQPGAKSFRRAGRCAEPGRGRVFAAGADARRNVRAARSARLPSAGARPAGRRVGRRFGNVRVRFDRRDVCARR
jgi:hypothetical protein